MTATVGVLRMAAATRVRAEAAAAALDLAAADRGRSVLVVRRLSVTAADREQARAELAAAREQAVRPSLGHAAAAATSVLFADEAEMLACMTRDLAAGDRPWYWQHVLPRDVGDTGTALAAVWIAQVRWLPAALALLAPGESVAAIRLIAPAHARRVLAALAEEFAVHDPRPSHDDAELPLPGRRGTQITHHAAVRHADAVQPAANQPLPEAVLPTAAAVLAPVARALLGLCLTLGRPVRRASTRPHTHASQFPSEPDHRTGSRAPQRVVRGSSGASTTTNTGTANGGQRPEQTAQTPGRTPDGPDPRVAPDGVQPPLARPAGTPVATDVPSWDPAFGTSIASALYMVNLLHWLAIPRPDWATVELLARHALGERLDEVGDDPLWDMLAVLDGREPGTVAEPRPDQAELTARVDALLADHELSAITFRRPGRIALTRTHLDVLLALDEVDLAARRCGLDRDPGWVPQLRRIVAFHFLGGTELLR